MNRLLTFFTLFVCVAVAAQTNPIAHDLRDSPYIFTSLSANPASTTYPPSMQGWSGDVENLVLGVSTDNQATGDQDLCAFCPADGGEIVNSGINGIALQAEAVAPQTGRAFAVALALNTTDCFGVQVAWRGIEAAHNNDLNIGGLELQYRVDSTGDWNAIPGQQYVSNLTTFVTGLDYQEFSTQLPAACNNQPYVQLRWALYHVNNFVIGNSLAVSKINVQADSVARQVPEDPYCRPLANVACEGSNGIWSGARPSLFINDFYSLVLGTATGAGVNNQSSGCGLDQGYSDFTDLVWTTTPGDALDYYATHSIGSLLGLIPDIPFINIYVDWNQDNDFEDIGETYPMVNALASIEFLATVNVPLTAVRGKTRMRVRISRDPIGDPCAPTADGEIEDYTVIVTSFVDCPSNPTPAVSDINICQTGVEFSWEAPTEGETPTGYRLTLGDGDDPTAIYNSLDVGNVTAFTLPDSITLEPGTTYFWKVVSYDAEGDANGCSTWNFTTAANGDPHPGVSVNGNPGSPSFGCFGSTDRLTARVDSGGAAPFSYEWMGANTNVLDRTDSATVFFTADTAGTYTYIVNVLDDNGCAAQDTLVINTVQGASTGVVTASNDSLCANETLTLVSVGPLASLQWQVSTNGVDWSNVTGAVRDTLEVVAPNDGSFYRLLASNIQCADTSEAFPITVFPQTASPNISTSSGVNFFCEGDSVTLYSDQQNNTWSTGATTDSIVVDTTARITLFYTDANGCTSDADTLQIIESAFPEKPLISGVSNTNRILLCGGLATPVSVNDSGLTVQWNDFPGDTNATLIVSAPGDVSVTVTNAFGCDATSDTVTAVVRDQPGRPDIGIDAGSLEFCDGDSVVFFSLFDLGNTVFWNGDSNITTQKFTAKESGDYFVEALNNQGCSRSSDTLTVVVNANPPKPNIASNTTNGVVCSNEVAFVTTDALDFFWNGDTTITTDSLEVTEDRVYFVTAVNPSGCEQNSDTLSFTFATAPNTPVITKDNGTLTASGAGSQVVYQWFTADDTLVAGETDSIFDNAPDGTYYVVVTDTVSGCSAQSSIISDIEDVALQAEVTIFPNPVSQGERVIIRSGQAIAGIIIKDAAGRVLQAQTAPVIETSGLSAGVYLVSIEFEGASPSIQKRLVIQ